MSKVRNQPNLMISCDSFMYTVQVTPVIKKRTRYIKLLFTDNYGNTATANVDDCDEWGSITIGGFLRDFHFLHDEHLEVCLYGLTYENDDSEFLTTSGDDEVLCSVVDSPAGVDTEEWWDWWYDTKK